MKLHHRQRGYLLITVVVTLFLLGTIAMLLAYDSANSAHNTSGELEAARAEYVLQAGMQNALWRAQNNACMGEVTIPRTALGPDSFEAWITGPTAGTSYTIAADQDAWIRSDDVSRNNGTTTWNHVRFETGKSDQVLTRFDLSAIPASTHIRSAVAWFHIKALKPHPEGAIGVHEVAADWAENNVTWDSFAGAYRSGTIGSIPAQDAGDTWVRINLTAQVQAWVNGQPNYGILFNSIAEGIHTEYTAREDGANPPRLEVVTGGDPGASLLLKAKGDLANGNSRITDDVAGLAYQPSDTVVLQLGTDPGGDAKLDDFYEKNYGGSEYLQLNENTGNWVERPLMKFDLGSLPRGAAVLSAQLELWTLKVPTPGAATVHEVNRSWVEGTQDGAGSTDGATWATWDGSNSWGNAGGDFNSTAVAEATVGTIGTWVSWDIGDLVRKWQNGAPNHGVMIKGDAVLREVELASKESADPALRPKLRVTFACQCGSPCMSPRGAGSVLMVIGNSPGNPSSSEQAMRDYLESWGYAVSFMQDDDSQGNYDAALASADVVFVSDTVSGGNVGTKLTNTGVGVVTAERELVDELGIATGNAAQTGNTVDVVMVDHYITAPFTTGTIDIRTASTEVVTVSGTVSPDAQQLALINGAGAVVAVDAGGQSSSGGTLAGRRVLIPVGEGTVSWDLLTNSGALLVQRSLDWAMGVGNTIAGNLLLVVGDAASPITKDQERKGLFESWGYTVTLIDDGADQAKFDTEAAAHDVIYVSASINGGTLADKLTTSAAAIVNEFYGKIDNFGFASGTGTTVTTDTFYGTLSEHYIAEPLGDNNVTVFTTNRVMPVVSGTLSPDMRSAAAIGTLTWALPTLDVNAERWDGAPSPGRRVHLPFGDANVSELTDDGKILMQRSLAWAAGAGPKYGLIAHWKLDEGTGVVAVDSEGGHDGTLDNGPAWTAGAFGDGVNFSEENHAITVPHSDSLTMTGDMTLLAWVNMDELLPNRPIIQKGTDNTDHNYFFGLYNDNMQFAVSPPGGGWHAVGSGATGISPGGWHHLAVSFDDSENLVVFYLDGAPFATQELTHSPSEFAGPLKIGRNRFNYGIKGSLDDVRVYRGALRAEEIAEIAERPPIAHWKLDETSGTTAVDSVGGHDGALVNGPSWETGHLEGALDFDGTNDFVNVPHDDGLSLTDRMSFTAWINASSFGNSYQTILAKDAGGAGSNYWFGTWQDLPVFGFFSGGLFREVFNPSVELQPNTWYHLAATFDNGTGDTNVYVDGALVQNGTLNFDPTAVTADVSMGRSPDGERWRGMLDDVRIYDEVLSASRIAALAGESGGGGGGGGGGDSNASPSVESFSEASRNSNGTTLDIAKPTGTTEGDLLIAAVAVDGDSATSFNPPSGWTLVNAGNNARGRVGLGVWWKIAEASEPSQYQYAWSGSEQAYGWITRVSGHDPSSPVLFDNGALTGDSSSGPICQRLITPVDDMMVLRIGGFDDDDIVVGTTGLDGHTPINMGKSGTGNASVSGGSGYFIQETAGDSDLAWFSLTRNEEFRTVTLGIRPAP